MAIKFLPRSWNREGTVRDARGVARREEKGNEPSSRSSSNYANVNLHSRKDCRHRVA